MAKFPKDYIFHVFNKSIANYNIFNSFENNIRFVQALDFYNNIIIFKKLSDYLEENKNFQPDLLANKNGLVKFLAYCVMPDHYHLLLKIKVDNCLSKYISDVENSYSRFFNTKNKRKGPLWQSRFKTILVRTNEQILHLSRYIHLNPTTNSLVKNPEDWLFSSYRLYLKEDTLKDLKEIEINSPILYKKFCEDRKDYQRQLKKLKKLIF